MHGGNTSSCRVPALWPLRGAFQGRFDDCDLPASPRMHHWPAPPQLHATPHWNLPPKSHHSTRIRRCGRDAWHVCTSWRKAWLQAVHASWAPPERSRDLCARAPPPSAGEADGAHVLTRTTCSEKQASSAERSAEFQCSWRWWHESLPQRRAVHWYAKGRHRSFGRWPPR